MISVLISKEAHASISLEKLRGSRDFDKMIGKIDFDLGNSETSWWSEYLELSSMSVGGYLVSPLSCIFISSSSQIKSTMLLFKLK